MNPRERLLRSRFRGALLGCAIGDALAFPYQDYSRTFMRALTGPLTESFERQRSGFHAPGQYTADTQTACAVAEAIIEAGGIDGQILAERMIPLWRDGTIVARSRASTEAMERLVRGEVIWREAGLPPGRVESCALSRTIPVGLWDHAAPEDLPRDVEIVTSITHRDPKAIAASAAFAAGLAHLAAADDIILGVLLDRIASSAGRFWGDLADAVLDFPRILSQTEYRAFEIFAALAARSKDAPPPTFEEGMTDNAVYTVLGALYCFLKSPFDFEKAVENALRCGGEVRTAAALVGAFGGALLGAGALPPALVGSVIDGAEIGERADRLFSTWQGKNPPPEDAEPASEED